MSVPFAIAGLDEYVEAHATPPTELMARLAEETRSTLAVPQMLTGTVEGRFLEFLVFLAQPKLVVEFGTYSGYSAQAMAAALPPDGRIITFELSDEHADFAQRHLDAGPHADKIEIRRGPALESLATVDGPIDLAFIDADKVGYDAYYEATLAKLSDRGVILLDNMLFSGDVLDPEPGSSAAALAALNDKLVADERVVCVLLSVRDGVTLVRKR